MYSRFLWFVQGVALTSASDLSQIHTSVLQKVVGREARSGLPHKASHGWVGMQRLAENTIVYTRFIVMGTSHVQETA